MVQTPLQTRPGHQYEDDWKPSEGNTDDPDNLEESFNAPDADYPEGHPSRKKSMSDDELANAEESAGSGSDDKKSEDKSSGDSSDDEESSLYKSNKKKKRRGITRRQGGIIGFISVMVISAFMAVITQGPGLVITHVRDMLLSRVGTVEQYNSRKYRQNKLVRARNLFSRDGRMGQKIIGEMEAKGYKFKFTDPTDRNKITRIELPNGKETAVLDGIGKEIDGFIDKRHPFRSARWKTKRMEAFYKKFGVTRTSVVDKAKFNEDEDPQRTVNKEVANDVVEENPKSIESAKATDSDDATDAEKAENEQKNKVGAETDAAASEAGDTFSEEAQNLKAGDVADEALESLDDAANPKTLELIKRASEGTLRGKAWDAVEGFLNPAEFQDKLCTMRNRLRQAQAIGRSVRAVKLIRYAGVFIKAGDGVRRGNVDMRLVNQLMKRVMSEDSSGNSFAASSGFSSLSSGKFNKTQNESTRNKIGVDGKLTGVLGGIKGFTDNVPGMSKCWLWQNPGFQVAAGAVDVIVSAVGCIFTGCAATAGKEAVKRVAEEGIKTVVENTVKRVITKKLIKDLAIGFAIDFGIDQAMTYMQLYAQKSMMLTFTGQEKGGQLSDILTAGTGTMEANRSAAAGLVPATPQQYAAAQQEYFAWKNEEKSKQSFFARVLDYNNPDSLAFNGVTAAIGAGSNNTTTTVTNLAQSATSLLNGGLFANVGSIFGGSASAADSDYIDSDSYTLRDDGKDDGKEIATVATDLAGNMHYIMRSDIEQIDPEANEDALVASGDIDATTREPTSSAFLDYVASCVDTPDVYSKIEFEHKDCLATKSETKRFAAHLAWLDMNDGLEAEFFPGSIESASASSTTIGGGTTPSSTVTDKRQDTSGMACAPTGLTAERIEPIGDGSVRIKLCDYGDVKGINASWSTAVTGMIAGAAADGITFSSGGFRTAAEQIRLRSVNGCPDIYTAPASSCRVPTARPGSSNHELGLAMDMRDMCFPRATCAGNQRYDWLVANAAKWGIKKLSTEAWHWSVDGR